MYSIYTEKWWKGSNNCYTWNWEGSLTALVVLLHTRDTFTLLLWVVLYNCHSTSPKDDDNDEVFKECEEKKSFSLDFVYFVVCVRCVA